MAGSPKINDAMVKVNTSPASVTAEPPPAVLCKVRQ
jgi:hypothetical protein